MDTILERVTSQQQLAEQEAQQHNAQIKERYKRLQNAEADQFAQSNTQVSNAVQYNVRASVSTLERPSVSVDDTPIFEQAPQVTEYVREKLDSSVFTTDKFQAVQQPVQQVSQAVAAVPQAPTAVATAAVAVASPYALTNFAKAVMAAFAAVVIVMLTLICVNTQLIRQRTVEVQGLQAQNAALQEEYAELQSRIRDAVSEETIREYALSLGMIQR